MWPSHKRNHTIYRHFSPNLVFLGSCMLQHVPFLFTDSTVMQFNTIMCQSMGTYEAVLNNSAMTTTHKLLHGHSERTPSSIWEPIEDSLVPWIAWYTSMKFGKSLEVVGFSQMELESEDYTMEQKRDGDRPGSEQSSEF